MQNMVAQLIKGGAFKDERGGLRYFNEFDMQPVKRFYVITHPDEKIVRAWQGHQKETKWFLVTKGGFQFVLLQPDNWVNPSAKQKLEHFTIHAEDSSVLHVPAGYINGFKASVPDSELIVFSDFGLEDSKQDDFRYDSSLWYNWQ